MEKLRENVVFTQIVKVIIQAPVARKHYARSGSLPIQMKWSIDKWIYVGFAMALVVLCVIGLVSYRNASQLAVPPYDLGQSREILERLNNVLSLMRDAEIGQRGYIITGEEDYLEPYRIAIAMIGRKMEDLRKLIVHNSDQQQKLLVLNSLITTELAEFKQTIELRKNKGFEAALQVILTDRGREVMDEIRSLVSEMEDEERGFLSQQLRVEEGKVQNTTYLIILGSLLAFALVSFATFIIHRDITERKRAERALAERAADLARSNAELEQFAYVASHDLQEPLRIVASYTQLLAKRYRGKLDASADEFIGFAVDGVHRMHQLINGLLAYSRVGSQVTAFKPIDCGAVFGNALANLQDTIKESGAVITHDPLPTVMADALQLEQVFRNLVGNAIKFHGEQPPQIHVSVEQRGDEWLFSVRDNGIGIDSQYADRIFTIFERLHATKDYPGTGIGLAICKKVVERHGGRIWVESQAGTGATFYFTIPKIARFAAA
jgi:signal transduction histidine kinase